MTDAPRSNRPAPRSAAAVEAELRRRLRTELADAREAAGGELDDGALAAIIARAMASVLSWHLDAPEHARNATLSSRTWRPAGGPRGGRPETFEEPPPRGPYEPRRPREFERGPREFERGPRDFERGPREFERGPREFERGPREFERGQREFERGQRDYGYEQRGEPEAERGPRRPGRPPARGGGKFMPGGGGGFKRGGFKRGGGGGGFKRGGGGFGSRRP